MSTSVAPPPPVDLSSSVDEVGAAGELGEPSTSTSTPSLPPLIDLLRKSVKRTRTVYLSEVSNSAPVDAVSSKAALLSKLADEYKDSQTLPPSLAANVGPKKPRVADGGSDRTGLMIEDVQREIKGADGSSTPNQSLVSYRHQVGYAAQGGAASSSLSQQLMKRKEARDVKPEYHPQWKLSRVISGHLGWVRAVAVEPGNQWFATGAGDRVIKVWDLASGELKVSLTGHISTVRGLAVSPRHPYLFSAGEDKMVKCWDLETNKVIRHYHGHLSGIYSMDLHPTLDVLVTAGRDATARVWDMRTKAQIHALTGHTGTIASVKCQESDPQIITGSMDSTIRLWDLAAGKTMTTLTHHKKSVRALAIHPIEYSFASGSAGGNNIKKWKCPEGTFVHNFSGHDAIINTMSVNEEGVMFSGADNGTATMWDYATGKPFQHIVDVPQPGSLDAESGIFCSTFDKTGTRLITGGADKTIKIYSEQG